jgi:hypothetical protein
VELSVPGSLTPGIDWSLAGRWDGSSFPELPRNSLDSLLWYMQLPLFNEYCNIRPRRLYFFQRFNLGASLCRKCTISSTTNRPKYFDTTTQCPLRLYFCANISDWSMSCVCSRCANYFRLEEWTSKSVVFVCNMCTMCRNKFRLERLSWFRDSFRASFSNRTMEKMNDKY